jgi:hypothetical protein
MIVAIDGIPKACASLIIRTHSSASNFLGQITFLTESTRISAAVPCNDPRPAAFNRQRTSALERLLLNAAWETSSGLNACR